MNLGDLEIEILGNFPEAQNLTQHHGLVCTESPLRLWISLQYFLEILEYNPGFVVFQSQSGPGWAPQAAAPLRPWILFQKNQKQIGIESTASEMILSTVRLPRPASPGFLARLASRIGVNIKKSLNFFSGILFHHFQQILEWNS